MPRKQLALDGGRGEQPVQRAARLVRLGHELGQVEYHYSSVVGTYEILFRHLTQNGLGDSEYLEKADRPALERLRAVLETDIRPRLQATREEFVRLCGFEWQDWVRVSNRGQATFELEPTQLYFRSWEPKPTVWLMGRGLKANGRPGSKIVQTPLVFGVSKVEVLSAAVDREAGGAA